MARRKDAKNIGIQLTPDEYEALSACARLMGRDKSFIIRAALSAVIPNFPSGDWSKTKIKNS
jgi:predicted DNA-binding protein